MPQRRFHILGERQRAADLGRLGLKDGACLRKILPDKGRDVLLEYSGLLGGDLSQCVSKKGAMIQSYACDYRKVWGYDIRAVKTASETDLDHCDIHFLIIEPFERHSGRDLEERQAQGIHIGLVTAEEIIDIFLGHQSGALFFPDNPHPLPEIHNVRRGVKADSETAGGQCRSEHIRDRSLAVRAGHVYRPQAFMRITQDSLELEHILKPGLVGILERNFLNRRESGEYSLDLPLVTLFGKWFHYRPIYLFFELNSNLLKFTDIF